MLKWATNRSATTSSSTAFSLAKPKSGNKLSDPGPGPSAGSTQNRLPCALNGKLSDPPPRPTQLPLPPSHSTSTAPAYASTRTPGSTGQTAVCAPGSGQTGLQRATRSITGMGSGAAALPPAAKKLAACAGSGIPSASASSSAMSSSHTSGSCPIPRPDPSALRTCSRTSNPMPVPATAPAPAVAPTHMLESVSCSNENENESVEGADALWQCSSGFGLGAGGANRNRDRGGAMWPDPSSGSGVGQSGAWSDSRDLVVEFSSEDESGGDEADEEPSPTSTSTGSESARRGRPPGHSAGTASRAAAQSPAVVQLGNLTAVYEYLVSLNLNLEQVTPQALYEGDLKAILRVLFALSQYKKQQQAARHAAPTQPTESPTKAPSAQQATRIATPAKASNSQQQAGATPGSSRLPTPHSTPHHNPLASAALQLQQPHLVPLGASPTAAVPVPSSAPVPPMPPSLALAQHATRAAHASSPSPGPGPGRLLLAATAAGVVPPHTQGAGASTGPALLAGAHVHSLGLGHASSPAPSGSRIAAAAGSRLLAPLTPPTPGVLGGQPALVPMGPTATAAGSSKPPLPHTAFAATSRMAQPTAQPTAQTVGPKGAAVPQTTSDAAGSSSATRSQCAMKAPVNYCTASLPIAAIHKAQQAQSKLRPPGASGTMRQSPARSLDQKTSPAPPTPQPQLVPVPPAPILSPTNPLQHCPQEQQQLQQQQLYSPSLSDAPLSESSGIGGDGRGQSVAAAGVSGMQQLSSAPTPGSSSVAGSSSSGYYSLLDSCGGASGPASARSSLVSSSASFEHEPKLLSSGCKGGDANSSASAEQAATAAAKAGANGSSKESAAAKANTNSNATQKAGRSGHSNSSGAPAPPPPPRGTTAIPLTQKAGAANHGAGLGSALRQPTDLFSPQLPRKSGIPAPGMSTLERQRGANGAPRSKSSGRPAATAAEATILSAIPIGGGGGTPSTSATTLASTSQSSMASSTTSQSSGHTPPAAGLQSHGAHQQQPPSLYQSASLTRAQVSALPGGHAGSPAPASIRPRAGASGGRDGAREEHKQEAAAAAHKLDAQSMESVASSASSGESRLPKLSSSKSKLPTGGGASGLPLPSSGLPLPSGASAASRSKVTTAVQAGNGHLRASRERDSASRRTTCKQIAAPSAGHVPAGSRTSPSPSPSPGPEARTRETSLDPRPQNTSKLSSSAGLSRVESTPSMADTAQSTVQVQAAAAPHTLQSTSITQSAVPPSQHQLLLSCAAQTLAGSFTAPQATSTATTTSVTATASTSSSSGQASGDPQGTATGTDVPVSASPSEVSAVRSSGVDESLRTGAAGSLSDACAPLSLLDGYHLLTSGLGLDLSNEEVDEELLESLTALPIALPAFLKSPFAHLKQLSTSAQSQTSLCSPAGPNGNANASPAAQLAALSMPPSLRLNLTRLLDRTRLNTIDESDSPPPLLSAAARAAAAESGAPSGAADSLGAEQQANGELRPTRDRRQGSLRLEKTCSYTTDYDSVSAISDADTAISSNDVSGYVSDGEHLTRAGSMRIGGSGLVGAASASTVCSLNQSDYFSDLEAVAAPALLPLYPGGRAASSAAGAHGPAAAPRAMRQQDVANAAAASAGIGAQGGAESELERTLRAGDAEDKASEASQCHQRVPSDQTDPDSCADANSLSSDDPSMENRQQQKLSVSNGRRSSNSSCKTFLGAGLVDDGPLFRAATANLEDGYGLGLLRRGAAGGSKERGVEALESSQLQQLFSQSIDVADMQRADSMGAAGAALVGPAGTGSKWSLSSIKQSTSSNSLGRGDSPIHCAAQQQRSPSQSSSEMQRLQRDLKHAYQQVSQLSTQVDAGLVESGGSASSPMMSSDANSSGDEQQTQLVASFENTLRAMQARILELGQCSERKDCEISQLRALFQQLKYQNRWCFEDSESLVSAPFSSVGVECSPEEAEDGLHPTNHSPSSSTDGASEKANAKEATKSKSRKGSWLMSSFGKAFSKKKPREQSDVISLATASCSKMGARSTTPGPSITGSPRKTSVPASAVCSPAGTLESSSQLLSTVHSGTLHSTIPCTPRITCRSATGARLESGAQPQQISPALLHCALSGYQSDSAEMQHLRSLEASRDELLSRMKAELQDKDARLTDAQLQSLATKHQMEQMKQLLISMKNEMKQIKAENESLQKIINVTGPVSSEVPETTTTN